MVPFSKTLSYRSCFNILYADGLYVALFYSGPKRSTHLNLKARATKHKRIKKTVLHHLKTYGSC